MLHLKLVIFAVLITGRAIDTEGFPAGENEQLQSTGYFDTIRNFCNYVWCPSDGDPNTGGANGEAKNGLLTEAASALGNGLYTAGGLVGKAGYAGVKAGVTCVATADEKNRIIESFGALGNGLCNGAKLVGTAGWTGIMASANFIQSEEGSKLLSEAASAVGDGVYNGVTYAVYGDTNTDEVHTTAAGNTGNGVLSDAATTVLSGLYTAGGLVGKAGIEGLKAGANYVRSKEGSELLSETASAVGSGLYVGAAAVGKASVAGLKAGANYVRSEEGNKLLSEAATQFGTGLYSGATFVRSGGMNGILTSLGACAQFTVSSLASALASVDYESLSNALGLSNISKALADKVDIYSVLTKLMMGQAQDSKGGVVNYATSTIFLQILVGLVPPLKKLLDAFQTVSYVMSKMRQLQSENKPIEPVTLMKEALNIYFMDVDLAFKQKLIDLSPLVYQAAIGEPDAARKIVAALANRQTVVETLKGMGYKRQIQLLQKVVGQVSDSATTVRELNAAKTAN